MSLLNSLYSGISGLRNHQTMMDVIGNNISNSNTIGFKGSRVTFSDAINRMMKSGTNPGEATGGTNSMQIGLGVKTNSIDRIWSQGTFERTGTTTDLALQGPGLFVLKSNGQTMYTRAGAFTFDEDGRLVNPSNGAIVQGKLANGGVIPAGNILQDIVIDKNQKLPAVATGNVTWSGNLSSQAPQTASEELILSGNLDSGDFAAGGTRELTTTIYNSDGEEFEVKVTLSNLVFADGGTANDPSDDTYTADASYEVFNPDGTVLIPATNLGGPLAFSHNNGEFTLDADQSVNLDEATFPALVNKGINCDLNFKGLTVNSGSNSLNLSADGDRKPTIVESTVTVFDSLGNTHKVNMKYTKVGDNEWTWKSTVPGTSTNDGNEVESTGTIKFNSDGSISSITSNSTSGLTFTPAGGAEEMNIEFNFGNGFKGITQTSNSSVISAISQDGSAAASLADINIDEYGNIEGIFSNGKSKVMAQLLVANFTNRNGLIGKGDNMFVEYANSGDARILELGEDSATTLQSGALEQSNVDLSEEFTKMIVSQRGFQANARVITTSDSLIQEITNLVR